MSFIKLLTCCQVILKIQTNLKKVGYWNKIVSLRWLSSEIICIEFTHKGCSSYLHRICKPYDKKILEGSTQVDALILNPDNGFNVLIEAKVLSDISVGITYDVVRNHLNDRNL